MAGKSANVVVNRGERTHAKNHSNNQVSHLAILSRLLGGATQDEALVLWCWALAIVNQEKVRESEARSGWGIVPKTEKSVTNRYSQG